MPAIRLVFPAPKERKEPVGQYLDHYIKQDDGYFYSSTTGHPKLDDEIVQGVSGDERLRAYGGYEYYRDSEHLITKYRNRYGEIKQAYDGYRAAVREAFIRAGEAEILVSPVSFMGKILDLCRNPSGETYPMKYRYDTDDEGFRCIVLELHYCVDADFDEGSEYISDICRIYDKEM